MATKKAQWNKTRGRGLPRVTYEECEEIFAKIRQNIHLIPAPPWLKPEQTKVAGRGRGRGLHIISSNNNEAIDPIDNGKVESVVNSNFSDDEKTLSNQNGENNESKVISSEIKNQQSDTIVVEENLKKEIMVPNRFNSDETLRKETMVPNTFSSDEIFSRPISVFSQHSDNSSRVMLNEKSDALNNEQKISLENAETLPTKLSSSEEESHSSPFEVVDGNIVESPTYELVELESKVEDSSNSQDMTFNETLNTFDHNSVDIIEMKPDKETTNDSVTEVEMSTATNVSHLSSKQDTNSLKLNIEISEVSSALEPIDIQSDPNALLANIDNNFTRSHSNKVTDLDKQCQIVPTESPKPNSSSATYEELDTLNMAIQRKLQFKKYLDSSESINFPKSSKGNRKAVKVPKRSVLSNRKSNTGAIQKDNLGNRGRSHTKKVNRKNDSDSSDNNGKNISPQSHPYFDRVRTPSPHHLSPRSKFCRPVSNPKLDSEKEFPRLGSEEPINVTSKGRSETFDRSDSRPCLKDIGSFLRINHSNSTTESHSNNCSSSDSNEATSFLNQYKVPVVKNLQLRNIINSRCEKNLRTFLSEFGKVNKFYFTNVSGSLTAHARVEFQTLERLDNLISSINGIPSAQFDPNSYEYNGEACSKSLNIEIIYCD